MAKLHFDQQSAWFNTATSAESARPTHKQMLVSKSFELDSGAIISLKVVTILSTSEQGLLYISMAVLDCGLETTVARLETSLHQSSLRRLHIIFT